jgi:DCN1-like protein 1/2
MSSTKLKSTQREKVRNFCLVTNCSEAIAINCLTASDWNLELAFDIYYQNPAYQESSNSTDSKKIDALFYRYANDPEDKKMMNSSEPRIGPNGMQRLLNDLNIDASSLNALIFAWKLRAETQCEFSLPEFQIGLREIKVDSLDKLRNQITQWPAELEDKSKFRQVYQFVFHYAKSASLRFLDIDTAIAYWDILFQGRDPRVPLWIAYLKQEKQRGISMDTWNLFFEFLASTNEDYSNYDSNSAWPCIVDAFVDYARMQK